MSMVPGIPDLLSLHYLYSSGCWGPRDGKPGHWSCAPACGAGGPVLPGETARSHHIDHQAEVMAEAGIDYVEVARVEALRYAAQDVDGPDGPQEMTAECVREWLLSRVGA